MNRPCLADSIRSALIGVMRMKKTIQGILLTVLVLLAPYSIAKEKIWSETKPAVNLTHIFQGETNRKGKPTGLHAKFSGTLAEGAKIRRIRNKPNKVGVYTAEISIKDTRNGQWKDKFSSMFPDSLTPKEVVKSILHAYKNREKGKKTPWRGPSGHGFPIEGYVLRDGRINTAFPVYIRDRKK